MGEEAGENNINEPRLHKWKVEIWATDQFHLKFADFMPILKLLAAGNAVISKLIEHIESLNIKARLGDLFPIRIKIPLWYSFSAVLDFSDLKIVDSSTFNLSDFFLPAYDIH